MNILEILEENSVLLEAVRISTANDAYELIKSKKLGVKMHPDYNDLSDKHKEWYIKSGVNNIINLTKNVNNIVYAVQLFINKVPIDQLSEVTNNYTIAKLIDYRNKPWAKENPEYKEFIELNGKPMNVNNLTDLSIVMEQEAQKHGHGDKKDVKNLYDDGIWTLQVPTSFKGAKAISFYGKKGEQQIPTEWCTRTDVFWYNKYANKSPLYVIRNWDTGKSYQISFEEDVVNFLDEKDVKGDKITRGNLLEIPNKLLELIKWNGKSLKDYKDMDKATTRGKLTKGSSFKDATVELERARWGDDIKLSNNVIKNVWENYSGVDAYGDKLTNYMIKNKVPGYVKHAGNWAAKYYFKNNPDYFILMKKADWEKNFEDYYYIDGNSDIEAVGLGEFEEGEPKHELLLKIAKDDIGVTKKENRSKKRLEHDDDVMSEKFAKEVENTFTKYFNNPNINKDFFNTINKYFPGCKVKLESIVLNKLNGRFLPSKTNIAVLKDNKKFGAFSLERLSKGLEYEVEVGYSLHDDLEKRSNQGDHLKSNFRIDIEDAFQKLIRNYSKEILKNKTGQILRSNKRGKTTTNDFVDPYRKTYYEDYFPY